MTDFDYENMLKKRVARGAMNRKCGSKSRRCTLPSDNLTPKQWRERCGEMHTYYMNEPRTWAQFKELPIHIQKEYITYLSEHYHASATSMADMFGVVPLTVRNYVKDNNFGIKFRVGKTMNAEQKSTWEAFKAGEIIRPEEKDKTDDAPEECCSAPEGVIPDVHGDAEASEMSVKKFSMTFQGKIDPVMIVNSVMNVIGKDATGTVEVICTL